MYQFDHPNVLKLTGVCLDGGPAPYIIMPFMINGSLLSHLKQRREELIVDMGCTDQDDAVSESLLQTIVEKFDLYGSSIEGLGSFFQLSC